MSALAFSLRRDRDRGRLRTAWLDARFSFSFGPWVDPNWPRFGTLLALNEDVVKPGQGFPMHPHEHLDIVMIPMTAPILHEDSLGGHSIVAPGEAQLIRAGSGILHSQTNAALDRDDHHLQMWFAPADLLVRPRVTKAALQPSAAGEWTPVLGRPGERAPLSLSGDVQVDLGEASRDRPLRLPAIEASAVYLHVVSGRGRVLTTHHAVEGSVLASGDALAFPHGAPDSRSLLTRAQGSWPFVRRPSWRRTSTPHRHPLISCRHGLFGSLIGEWRLTRLSVSSACIDIFQRNRDGPPVCDAVLLPCG